MSRNYTLYFSENNIQDDHLSRFLRGFTFEPHDFGHQYDDPRSICDYRVTGDFEIIFVIGGESHITLGGKEYVLTDGDLILIPSFEKHKIQTPAENPHNNYFIHFDVHPFHKQKLFIEMFTCLGSHVIKIDKKIKLKQIYILLKSEYTSEQQGSRFYFGIILNQIITEIFRQIYPYINNAIPEPTQIGSKEKIVMSSISFMMEHIHQPLTISDICSTLSISEPYLFKAFASVTGISPVKYFSLQKIKYAEQLMKTTDMTFKEIAEHLSYSSPYYFSNVFKQYYQMSPRAYMNIFNTL